MTEPEIRRITASDGTCLHFRHWQPARPVGIVVGLHGIQSHSGWYEYSSSRMREAGYAVYFADRRGSGLNDANRGHADHAVRLLNDVRQLIQLARRENQGLSVTLLGLSWGGKTAAAFARTWPDHIDRLALLYPGLCPRLCPNLWQRFLLWFARTHDIRHRTVAIPLTNPALFTDSAEWQSFIRKDSLTLHSVTTGFLNAGIELDRILRNGEMLPTPTLLMLAGRDQIIDNHRTLQLAKRLFGSGLKKLEYPHARHTLEFDSDRSAIVDDLISWLQTE